jgi:hypothetical protein
MPAVSDKETSKVSLRDLADLLDRDDSTVSRCARGKYFCAGYPVWEWAVWHPRGNVIRHYQVPKHILRDLVPQDEHVIYGL